MQFKISKRNKKENLKHEEARACSSLPLSSVREKEFSELDLDRSEEEIQEGLFPLGAHVCFLKQ